MSKFAARLGFIFSAFTKVPGETLPATGLMFVGDSLVTSVEVGNDDSRNYEVWTDRARYVFNRDSFTNAEEDRHGMCYFMETTNGMGRVSVRFYANATYETVKTVTDYQYDYD